MAATTETPSCLSPVCSLRFYDGDSCCATSYLKTAYIYDHCSDPDFNCVFVSAAATYAAPASVHVIEYVTPAPVIENIEPVPAVTSDVPSQQLPPACTTTTDITDDNIDMIGLVYPQFTSAAVEPFLRHKSLFQFSL